MALPIDTSEVLLILSGEARKVTKFQSNEQREDAKGRPLVSVRLYVQGDDEPQWPTPLIATSLAAAISAMNGAPLAGKPLRQNRMSLMPWS